MKISAHIKEQIWLFGLLVVVVGGFSAFFPILNVFADLSPYSFGFFISGLAIMDFGVLFALVSLYASNEKKKTKLRNVLVIAVVIYAILISYFLWIQAILLPEFEWKVEALVSGQWTLFGAFIFNSYNAFFVTLISFGIIVLPFAIDESGILSNYPD